MNYRMSFHIIGNIMKLEALLMGLALAVSFIYKEGIIWPFLIPILMLIIIGFILSFKKPEDSQLSQKEGFIVVALSWIIISIFGALPFILSGALPSFVDSLFETVSGFTTTGASVIKDVEIIPRSILFWRSFTNWIGGMGILVFVLAFLPNTDTRYMYIMKAEVPGPSVGKLVSRIRVTARILYGIYLVLTLMLILILVLAGMPLFDSLLTGFSTAGTGGFAIKNTSIAFYKSASIDYIISIFMLLFAINFNVFYFIILKKFSSVFKDEELRLYLIIIFLFIIAISFNIMDMYEGSFLKALRYSSFQVTSIISTTGFSTADYTTWPFFSQFLLAILMFAGGMAGSTAGGIKIKRLLIMIKSAFVEGKKLVNPRSFIQLKVDKKPLDEKLSQGIFAFFGLYFILFFLAVALVSLDGFSSDTAIGSVLSCLSNVGPGLGQTGPSGNYSIFSNLSKLVLSFSMLAGRLEIFPLLLLFSPRTWKK